MCNSIQIEKKWKISLCSTLLQGHRSCVEHAAVEVSHVTSLLDITCRPDRNRSCIAHQHK